MVDADFAKSDDDCMRNPKYCTDGFSFSLFYHAKYKEEPEELLNLTRQYEREYLMSTGGDDQGSPGFAIYREGATLGAIVSTGNLSWTLEIVGAIPQKNSWANIGLKWEPHKFENKTDLEHLMTVKEMGLHELGGLHLYVNLELIGFTLMPNSLGQGQEVRDGFDPPEMMLGCHRTAYQRTKRNFDSGQYDELAFWDTWLNETDNVFMMGGYRKSN